MGGVPALPMERSRPWGNAIQGVATQPFVMIRPRTKEPPHWLKTSQLTVSDITRECRGLIITGFISARRPCMGLVPEIPSPSAAINRQLQHIALYQFKLSADITRRSNT